MSAKKPGPGRRSGRTWDPQRGDWTERFYYPMPSMVAPVVVTPEPSFSSTREFLAVSWDQLPEWCKDHALKAQGAASPPTCKSCKERVITYPFHCVESWAGVWCTPCDRERYPVRPPVVLSTTDPDAWVPTHHVQSYGLPWERVRIIKDETHMDYGFRYGEMHIEYVDLRMREVKARWISFGRYSYQEVQEASQRAS